MDNHCEIDRVIISKVAGCYLVFDRQQIAFLRRQCAACGVLVGTVPQSPTQNVFLGVPLELSEEEVQLLTEQNLAYVRNEAQFQKRICEGVEAGIRTSYIVKLKFAREEVRQVVEGRFSLKHRRSVGNSFGPNARGAETTESTELRLHPHWGSTNAPIEEPETITRTPFSVTWTNIALQDSSVSPVRAQALHCTSLLRRLRTNLYYTTPGMRFGAHLSVYPGDPFRFHAHYVANHCSLDESVSLLDIVSGGRLSTTVKKGFLIGGSSRIYSDDTARLFCIEWAGM